MRHPALFIGTTLAPLLLALPVSAQNATVAPPPAQAAQADPAAAHAVSEDIIVTARRREERLQDVPVAIAAIGGSQLAEQNIRNAVDLTKAIPTLGLTPVSGNRDTLVFELRGISASEALIPQDPGVAVYVNDVVAARPQGVQGALYDLESVQVLYGPQGTLFGRNSTAGAILFTSKKPVLGQFGGEASVTLGDYGRKEVKGVLNIPLGDTLALRIAGDRKKVDGFTHELVHDRWLDNENSLSGRASLLWKPSSTFQSLTIADYYKSDTNGTGNILSAARPFNTIDPEILRLTGLTRATGLFSGIFGAANPAGVLAAQVARGPRQVQHDALEFSNQRVWSISNTTTVNITDDLTLKNIAGYRHIKQDALSDLDGSILPGLAVRQPLKAQQVSEEVQLQGVSIDKQLDWIVGGYFFRESGLDTAITNPFNPSPAAATITEAFATNTSRSIFGQATFRPAGLEALSLTAGLRYTWDTRQIEARGRTAAGVCQVYNDDAQTQPLPNYACSKPLSADFSKPSYNLTADYKLAHDVLVYVAHRYGYRSGGFNPRGSTPSTLIPFKPETISDVEIGIKSSFASGDFKGRFNLAAYIADYKNIQRSTAITTAAGIPATNIVNAAKARIKGGEATLMLSPTPGLELTLNGSLTDFTIQTINTSVQTQTSAFGPSTLIPVTVNDIPGSSPTYNLGANLQYTTSLGEKIGALSTSFNYKFIGKSRSPLSLPFYEAEAAIPGYGIANANIRLNDIGDTKFYAMVFVDNLFDKTVPFTNLSIESTFGVTTQVYNPPRMFGIEVGTTF